MVVAGNRINLAVKYMTAISITEKYDSKHQVQLLQQLLVLSKITQV